MYIKFDVEFPEDGVISPESRALYRQLHRQRLRDLRRRQSSWGWQTGEHDRDKQGGEGDGLAQ